jgi:hypothetical protein
MQDVANLVTAIIKLLRNINALSQEAVHTCDSKGEARGRGSVPV